MALSTTLVERLLTAVRTPEQRDELVAAINAAAEIGTDEMNENLLKYVDVTIPTASVLTLFDTPVTLVAAPGAGKAIVVEAVYCTIDYNSAAYVIQTGDTLNINYTGGSTVAAFNEAFLESSADARAYVKPAVAQMVPAVNTAVSAKISTTNPTTGDSDLKLRVYYRVIPSLL